MTKRSRVRYFKTSPEIIRITAMLHIRVLLSLQNVEDLLHERDIESSHETMRYWWNGFGLMFAAEIRRGNVERKRVPTLAVARPQSLIEDQWHKALPFARQRS